MRRVKRKIVDDSGLTVVALCPHCTYRTVSHDQLTVRRLLREHLYGAHGQVESQKAREAMNLWFKRNGVNAA